MFARNFLSEAKNLVSQIDIREVESVVEVLLGVYKSDGTVVVFGNGGSASLASHFTSDINSTTLGHKKNLCRKKI